MANMIIKPAADGNLLIQDRAGGAVLSTTASGATIVNATLTSPTIADLGGVPSVLPAKNEGLVVKYVSATTVDIDADFLTVSDTNNVATILSSINLTADITASGVNGLDTGSEAAVWYHIYVIYNGTTVASLLSASATSPTMPSGYTYKKYVGAVYNRSSSFSNFYQRGNDVILPKDDSFVRVVVNGTATNYASVALSAVIPTTTNVVIGYYGVTETSTRALAYVAATAAGMGEYMLEIKGSSGDNTGHLYFDLVLVETQTMYYYRHTSLGDDVDVYITGYKFSGVV